MTPRVERERLHASSSSMDGSQPKLSVLQAGGELSPTMQVESPTNQDLGQLLHF